MKIFAVTLFVVGLVAVASAQGRNNRKVPNNGPGNSILRDAAPDTLEGATSNGVCYNEVGKLCDAIKKKLPTKLDDRTCSAITSHFEHFEGHLMKFANLQFEISYKYLLLAAQFDSYTKDRPGFHSKFQALSDRSWAAGQEIIKYVTKRGANFQFENQNELNAGLSDLNEFQAMATVLDTEKYLFEKARLTHKGYSHSDAHKHYDPEAAHYIEEEYLHDLADSVRKYSGFANDLKNLYSNSKDINMDNYLFDQYLQKV